MMNIKNKMMILVGILGLLISGCGSGGGDINPGGGGNDPSNNETKKISGTAATGKPIAFGAVTLKDSTGATVGTLTDANGDYSIDVAGKTPPYMLRVVPDVPGAIPLHSIAYNTAGTTPVTNITPLTNLILYEARGRSKPGPVFDSGDLSKLTVSAVDSAHDLVRANFLPQLTANGLDPTTVDLLHTPFSANSHGLDGVLDDVNVSLFEGKLFIYGSRGQCVRYGRNLSGITLAVDGMVASNFWTLFPGISTPPVGNSDLSDVTLISELDDACVTGEIENVLWTRNPSLKDTLTAVTQLKIQLRNADARNRLAISRKQEVGPINIVAHSWGTVIAYIALLELEQESPSIKVQNLFTIGSPLQCLSGDCSKLTTLFIIGEVPPSVSGKVIRKPSTLKKWINYWGDDDPISKSISVADDNQYVQCTGRIVNTDSPGFHLCNIVIGTGFKNHTAQYFTKTPGSVTETPVLSEIRSLINSSKADSSPLPPVVQPPIPAIPTPPGDFALAAGTPYCDTRAPAGPAVKLAWSASTDAVHYRVYRNGIAISVLLGASQFDFINELGLVAGQTYSYKTSARNADGGTWSNTIQVTIPNDVCSISVSSPIATIISPVGGTFTQGVAVTFSGTGNDVEDGVLSGSSLVWTSNIDGLIGTGTSFSKSNLSVGIHTISLTATDSQGAKGSKSTSITVNTQATAPTPPRSLSATAMTSSVINLIWTDTSSNETGFKIERRTGTTGAFSLLTSTSANSTSSASFENAGLAAAGTTFCYQVRSFNATGNSVPSNVSCATTKTRPPVQATATNSPATSITPNSARLKGIVNPNGVATGFFFEWGTNSSPPLGNITGSRTIGSGTSNVSVAADITGLSPNTIYRYRVVAVNPAGTTFAEPIQTFRTLREVPPADTTKPIVNSFSVTPSSRTLGSAFTISWSVSDQGGAGLLRVELWRAPDNGGSQGVWARIKTSAVSGNGPASGSFTDAPPSSGMYWYGVHAVDGSGNFGVEPKPQGPAKVTVITSGPSERITNGSFTSGSNGWFLSGDFWVGSSSTRSKTSPGYAAGGVDSTGVVKKGAFGYLEQTIVIPASATSAILTFWINITSVEVSTTPSDVLSASIIDNNGGSVLLDVYSNLNKDSFCDTSCTYNRKAFDLTAFKGQTIRIRFLATTNLTNDTVFRIDDVSLMADG